MNFSAHPLQLIIRPCIRVLPTITYLPYHISGRRAFSVAGLMAWNSLPDFFRLGSNEQLGWLE